MEATNKPRLKQSGSASVCKTLHERDGGSREGREGGGLAPERLVRGKQLCAQQASSAGPVRGKQLRAQGAEVIKHDGSTGPGFSLGW